MKIFYESGYFVFSISAINGGFSYYPPFIPLMLDKYFTFCFYINLLVLLALTCFFSTSQAVQPERLRFERHSKTHGVLWSEKKIEKNFERQLQLIKSLGYLAYYHNSDSNEKWAILLKQFQRIRQKRELLQQGIEIRGRRLPKDTQTALKKLRQSMFASVSNIYGETAKNQLLEYLALHR